MIIWVQHQKLDTISLNLREEREQLLMIFNSFEKLSVQSPTYLVLNPNWLGCLSWGSNVLSQS
jgi:hypothetical protein